MIKYHEIKNEMKYEKREQCEEINVLYVKASTFLVFIILANYSSKCYLDILNKIKELLTILVFNLLFSMNLLSASLCIPHTAG